jgi:hypothetical protein
MRRTFAYFINFLAIAVTGISSLKAQDTLLIPLRINFGFEAVGPVTYLLEKKTLNLEGNASFDLNEKYSVAVNIGYLDYDFSQYNYKYLCSGPYARAGIDINILKPKKSFGKYWGGIGLRYGISRFKWEVPEITQNNYWGKSATSIPATGNWGHFLELSPGMRADFFKNFSMGWSVNIRMLIYEGSRDGIKPIHFPGFGNSEKRIGAGFSYYIAWHIPYKKIKVITRKEEPEEENPDEEDQNNLNQTGRGNRSSNDFRQQPTSPVYR